MTADSPYLLVVESGKTSRVSFPDSGEISIGNVAEAQVRWQGDEPPVRIVLRLTPDGASLNVLQGTPGILVNDRPARDGDPLAAGDRIAVGPLLIGLQGSLDRQVVRTALDAIHLRQRLAEESERFLRYESQFAVLVVDLGEHSDHNDSELDLAIAKAVRRVDVIGWTGPSELVVVFPETSDAADIPARRVLSAVLSVAPRARGGLALCPADACGPDAVLNGARTAARCCEEGKVARVSEVAKELKVGELRAQLVDPLMVTLFELVRQLAGSELAVLIQGETGAGKEVVAQAIHAWSRRSGRSFVAMNCAAIPENLLESELFGYERGAFSGAVHPKAGLLEKAAGGTLFLDEVGDLSAAAQAKLLRVLETHRVTRVGATTDREVDVRVVSATHRDLDAEAAAQRFRRDLFFRLSAATVVVPPLRDRPLDLALLATAFLQGSCDRLGVPRKKLSPGALRRLALHGWPGNVRELKNLMDYVAASVAAPEVQASQLPDKIAAKAAPWMLAERTRGPSEGHSPESSEHPKSFRNIYEEIQELERTRIREALEAAQGTRVKAAQLIGMPLRTMLTKMKQYGLETVGDKPGSGGRRRG